MEEKLFDDTKLAAYHLWEHTRLDNTLQLWYCVEDIACFLKQSDILTDTQFEAIVRLNEHDLGYIQFVRHIAYRIYVYTGNSDALFNWYTTENLLGNMEWRQALVGMASFYSKQKIDKGFSFMHRV